MTPGNACEFDGQAQNIAHSVLTNSTVEVGESDTDEELPPCKKKASARQPFFIPRLARLVSQDRLSCMTEQISDGSPSYVSSFCEDDEDSTYCQELDKGKNKGGRGRESPMRCVSEFDKVANASIQETSKVDIPSKISSGIIPPLPNPLVNSKVLSIHMRALRMEAELQPLRVVISRLMGHQVYNRKGIFNQPVDPVSLGLPDYLKIIRRPMDLGTIKARLHAVAYGNQDEVVDDVRLVFHNAMLYNPPGNLVHVAAKNMLAYFEELCETLIPNNFSARALPTEPPSSPRSRPAMIIERSSSLFSEPSSQMEIENEPDSKPHGKVTDGEGLSPEALPFEVHVVTCNSVSSAVSSIMDNWDLGPSHKAVHKIQSTRSGPSQHLLPVLSKPTRRRKPTQTRAPSHSCSTCQGRICLICNQGCLTLEPPLLVCTGPNCAGAKIRKGSTYYISKDGSRQFCQRCYTSLAAVMPQTSGQDPLRYKRDLLKRKNDEEMTERWLTCSQCESGVHQICALFNEYVHSENDWPCPKCKSGRTSDKATSSNLKNQSHIHNMYTFVSGDELPIPISEAVDNPFRFGEQILSADLLQETPVSSFIQDKVRARMVDSDCPNSEQTVLVRIISDCEREFHVPEVVRKHFRMETKNLYSDSNAPIPPPSSLMYHSKAIALFQKIDSLDVCIFCMYVQEYDGNESYESAHHRDLVIPQKKRVYIAYLDSVEHFRPRSRRTQVYHEMLVSYLATARARGYETAHIWACPPSRGNSFVFWNHPSSQRTPSKERLESWYHGALSRAVDCGVVTDVQSLYESDFHRFMAKSRQDDEGKSDLSGRMVCPPLFDGDFWIEEAIRLHSASIARHLKTKFGETPSGRVSPSDMEGDAKCPAIQVASLLKDKLMAHPSSIAFRRPVNAVALNLKDYHIIIEKPMDLGTVYSRCVMGEYQYLKDVISDVQLVFANAKRYNPVGHIVHERAIEVEAYFFDELTTLTKSWCASDDENGITLSEMSMSLDNRLESAPCQLNASCQLSDAKVESLSCEEFSDRVEQRIAGSAKAVDKVSIPKLTESSDSKAVQKRSCSLKVELLAGGPNAVCQRMVGEDVWLLDKKNPQPPKVSVSSKKVGGKRKRVAPDGIDDAPKAKRRQCWLGDEVGASVRRMRTSFFCCSLLSKQSMTAEEKEKVDCFEQYIKSFSLHDPHYRVKVSHIADARHALHELSQYRNFEFDTLRHAKYSTAMLLYHLHNDNAPGQVPTCGSCHHEITEVRWHKVNKGGERAKLGKVALSKAVKVSLGGEWQSEELCSSCHAKHPKGDDFIPLQISLKPTP